MNCTDNKSISIAIIGCGVVSQYAHIPICSKMQNVHLNYLVDKNVDLANKLASQYEVPNTTSNLEEIIGKVDAAIIATPHKSHHPIAIQLLKAGIHVLVEKPMTLSYDHAQEMIETATTHEKVLAVGQFRRLQADFETVKKVIDQKWLGQALSFEAEEGNVFNSPIESPAMFNRKTGGGGVLADIGPHIIDTLIGWFGTYESFEYKDDSCGGVEANCLLNINFQEKIHGKVELSRMRKLKNRIRILFEKGFIEVPTTTFEGQLKIHFTDADLAMGIHAMHTGELKATKWPELMQMEIHRFILAIHEQREYFIDAKEAALTVKLIEECYQNTALLTLY